MDSSSRWWRSNALTKLDCQVPKPEASSHTFYLLSRAHTNTGSWRQGGNYSFSLPNGLEISSVVVKFIFSDLNPRLFQTLKRKCRVWDKPPQILHYCSKQCAETMTSKHTTTQCGKVIVLKCQSLNRGDCLVRF